MGCVVITGMGAVSPLGSGVGVDRTWLRAGASGLRHLPAAMVEDIPCKVGGLAPSVEDDPEGGFTADRFAAPKDQRKMDRFILLALAAAAEALKQTGWALSTAWNDRPDQASRPLATEYASRTASALAA